MIMKQRVHLVCNLRKGRSWLMERQNVIKLLIIILIISIFVWTGRKQSYEKHFFVWFVTGQSGFGIRTRSCLLMRSIVGIWMNMTNLSKKCAGHWLIDVRTCRVLGLLLTSEKQNNRRTIYKFGTQHRLVAENGSGYRPILIRHSEMRSWFCREMIISREPTSWIGKI